MKRFYFLCPLLSVAILCACSSDIAEESTTGGIAGSVSDRTTGEPVATVNVSISPGGSSTVTGSDGTFSFRNLDEGSYTLTVTKEGYKQNSSAVAVRAGDPTLAHLLIERIPAVVTADRELLDFGANESTNTLSFNIVNPGYVDLEWEIEERCDWITEVKPAKGTLKYGKTEAIVVVIDRKFLAAGPNQAVIVVRSSNGSSNVKVTAVGAERYVPHLNTLAASEITSSSATLNGEITDAGAPAYTERGFVYALSSMPTLDNMLARLTSPVTEDTAFSYVLNGLTLGETYYVRAYAINSVGTAYSTNEINFTTAASSPELTVQEVTDMSVSGTSATFNGTVVNAGDPAYFERGFVYSTDSNPTVDNVKVKANGTGTGSFSVNASDLKLNQRYYVRTYVISKINDSESVIYSKDEVSFVLTSIAPDIKTLQTTNISIANGSAVLNGTIISEGEPGYTEKGFVYGKLINPTINDIKLSVLGNGSGEYSLNVNNLQEGYEYCTRAYVMHLGNVVYGNNVWFSFVASSPVINTLDVTNINIGASTVVFNGNISSLGDLHNKERGFVYSKYHNPTITDNKIVASGTGIGAFYVVAKDIEEGYTYYVRAYATNDKETIYGDEKEFSFYAVAPVVETLYPININSTSIAIYGQLISVGDPILTEKGFICSTLPNPSLDDMNIMRYPVSGAILGSYMINISGLITNQRYYIRAYAINDNKRAYGEIMSIIVEEPKYTFVGDNLLVQMEDVSMSDINWESANYACQGSSVGGFNDWRLPTMEEASILYQNKSIIDGFVQDKIVDEYVDGSVTNIGGINYHKSYYNRVYKQYYYWCSSLPYYSMINFTTAEVKQYENNKDAFYQYYMGAYGPNMGTSMNYEKYYRDVKTYNFRARCVRTIKKAN